MLFSLLKFSDENNIAKLVFNMWGNCCSRLCQLTFPKFNTFRIFLFRLHFRKFVNSLLNYPLNKLAKFLSTFSSNFINFWPHSQASLKIAFVKFGHIFMKFRKLKNLQLENKKLDCHSIFTALVVCILWGKNVILNFWLMSSD